VRSLTFDYLIAWMRFMGTPEIPKPPTSRREPFFMPEIAYYGVLQILEKRFHLLNKFKESISLNLIMLW
jgi:hypothetical protein